MTVMTGTKPLACGVGGGLEPPLAILAELTHRCPLACPYCSNPLELEAQSRELDTATWKRVLDEAAEMGVLQVHFSGGEPLLRRDIEELITHASGAGLYVNLITSAAALDRARIERLRDAGLHHIQISFQDTEAKEADRIAGFPSGHERKLKAAREVVAAGVALTVNAVIQRSNIDHAEAFIDLALELGAGRIEIANVQYYGWALLNRPALMPTREQLIRMDEKIRARLPSLKGRLVVDYVVPDYYARRPKACMGGWGRRFMNITPSGKVLPCHAAETIPNLAFETVKDRSLAEIWTDGPAFAAYRGTAWMPEPCQGCEFKEVDWGGCRCQALAIAGDASATDPICERSDKHALVAELAERDSTAGQAITYRGYVTRK
ncbi:pyrroloquinoline quinone biosynthesis protein PqqE [Azospirillum sp. SYSU D00513]|uniref:pyrroloquinoline quinone biosynthesis protein PqqE n=1 Tax=Azospirillum sp. SYSU D00513 TaxID=2812561 RepID=UPI0020001ABB|nr:pyrroloquinoline quinone biosynthesis protein PqqE [Azospirillum sp. SYSU D00513]